MADVPADIGDEAASGAAGVVGARFGGKIGHHRAVIEHQERRRDQQRGQRRQSKQRQRPHPKTVAAHTVRGCAQWPDQDQRRRPLGSAGKPREHAGEHMIAPPALAQHVDRSERAQQHEHARLHVGAHDLRQLDVNRVHREQCRADQPHPRAAELAAQPPGQPHARDPAGGDHHPRGQQHDSRIGIGRGGKPGQPRGFAKREIDRAGPRHRQRESIQRDRAGVSEPVRVQRVVAQHVERGHQEQRLVRIVERGQAEANPVEPQGRRREQDQAQQRPLARSARFRVAGFGARFRLVHEAKDVEQRCKP